MRTSRHFCYCNIGKLSIRLHVNWISLTSRLPQGAKTVKSEGSGESNPHMTQHSESDIKRRPALLRCARVLQTDLLYPSLCADTLKDLTRFWFATTTPANKLKRCTKIKAHHKTLFLAKKWGRAGVGGTVLSAWYLQNTLTWTLFQKHLKDNIINILVYKVIASVSCGSRVFFLRIFYSVFRLCSSLWECRCVFMPLENLTWPWHGIQQTQCSSHHDDKAEKDTITIRKWQSRGNKDAFSERMRCLKRTPLSACFDLTPAGHRHNNTHTHTYMTRWVTLA